MLVRIVEPGFETFTGLLIGVPFKDGVSVRSLIGSESSALGGLFRVEALDGGAQIGVSADMVRNVNQEAPVVNTSERGVDGKDVKTPLPEVNVYSREDLETLADAEGISGLRKIAEPLGIKGKSINDLIRDILAKQTPGATSLE